MKHFSPVLSLKGAIFALLRLCEIYLRSLNYANSISFWNLFDENKGCVFFSIVSS